MKFSCVIILSLMSYNMLYAQHTKFIASGNIEFERKINLYKLYENKEDLVDLLKKNGQQFKRSFFTLVFDNNKTIYRPAKDNPENYKFIELTACENIVYTDLDKNQNITQKDVFGNKFLIADTLKKLNWKITNETRKIAGFECKRANTIIMDSVYVVAYFTEEILTEGGPESFAGLPGMIMGLAIPHEHITWFATNINILEKFNNIEAPTKGTQVSLLSFKETIKPKFILSDNTGRWFYKFALL